jgi:hypothetical protein
MIMKRLGFRREFLREKKTSVVIFFNVSFLLDLSEAQKRVLWNLNTGLTVCGNTTLWYRQLNI